MSAAPAASDALIKVDAHNRAWQQPRWSGCSRPVPPRHGVFHDHAAGASYRGCELRDHVRSVIERSSLNTLVYRDRPLVDGDTVVLRYRETARPFAPPTATTG